MYSLGIVAMETQTSMILPASDRLCSAGMRSIGQGATRPRPWLKEKGWSSTTSIKLMGLGWLESYRIWLYALTPTIILTSPKKPWFSRGFTHLSHLGVFNIRGVGLRSKGPKTAEIPYHCDPPQKQSGDWWLSNHENRQNNQILVLPSCRYIDR